MEHLSYRPERVAALMASEGLAEMQAINAIRNQSAIHNAMRRDPRAFDFRFGREL